ncbi:hypothetical protein [Chloroflexus sp.]|uniref:hypothetical protein n=1 Tax=Chloroflexus sp. TaxID=1904827 RepID=UPI00261AC8CB|nr:hypothetical protein [uncultured Chloroflexus sp.]
MIRSGLRLLQWVVSGCLLGLLTLYLWYAAEHIRHILAFPFPLDYGEGPLVAQVSRLADGKPLWHLYADPAQPPFLIVNYPPLYLLLSGGLTRAIGTPLLAGRLITLIGGLAIIVALAALIGRRGAWLALLWPTIPIVREWLPLMRVDLLGVALGLWAVWLAGNQRLSPRWRGTLAAILAVGCLLTKPSLIAGPLAAGVMLLIAWMRHRASPNSPAREAVIAFLVTAALGGGGIVAGLVWATNGWFLLHVVAANANRWEFDLAAGFWRQQLGLRWPLLGTALIGLIAVWQTGQRTAPAPALVYLLAGTLGAIGSGKVGAYANYFFEWYAGLIWLTGLGWDGLTRGAIVSRQRSTESLVLRSRWLTPTIGGLLIASLLYYPPLWDTNRLRPAGLIEPSPPRLSFGRYGVWADAQREAAVLGALARVNQALAVEAQAAGDVIFTDLPGLASGAGVVARIPVFEFRQLLDQGLADQTPVLRALANGEFSLILLDYLGNWLTPEMIAIIRHRYAQDGSLGVIDRYRPVATGPSQLPAQPVAAGGVQLSAVQLAPPLGAAYEPGELVTLNLVWQRTDPLPVDDLTVVVRLLFAGDRTATQSERSLVYGALPPSRWPMTTPVEHLQPIALPLDLLPGAYQLAVGLRDANGRDLIAPQPVATLNVEPQGGAFFGETGYFVPATMMRTWAELGAVERGGWPLTPAVPFAWGWLQCFERICLEWRNGAVQMRALGYELYLAETIRSEQCLNGAPATAICPNFTVPEELLAGLGVPLSGELSRNGWIAQWTTYARLERSADGSAFGLGRLGDETLRLPPGVRYRWPE